MLSKIKDMNEKELSEILINTKDIEEKLAISEELRQRALAKVDKLEKEVETVKTQTVRTVKTSLKNTIKLGKLTDITEYAKQFKIAYKDKKDTVTIDGLKKKELLYLSTQKFRLACEHSATVVKLNNHKNETRLDAIKRNDCLINSNFINAVKFTLNECKTILDAIENSKKSAIDSVLQTSVTNYK